MITTHPISVDFITKSVISPAEIVCPLGADLLFLTKFTGTDDTGAAVDLVPSLTAFLLTLKESLSGEVVLQTDGIADGSGNFVSALNMSGDVLAATVADSGRAALIAEIKWTIANPFTELGSTITTRSKTFPINYATSY